jgi:hypothetical protein
VRIALLALLLVVGGTAAAAERHGAPLPKRAKAQDDGTWLSPLGFRDTVEWYRKAIAKDGTTAEILGVEKFRDVVYLRILARDRTATWSAIHVFLAEGRTFIYIVAP